MKRFLAFWSLVLTLSITSSVWASEIFGKISYKGAPLKSAELTLNDKTGKTNDLGFYSITADPGSYVLKIKLPDGTSHDEKVEVFPQSTEKNLKLE